MKSISYFDESQQQWLIEREMSLEKVLICFQALSAKSNSLLTLWTDESGLTVIKGKQKRYFVRYWLKIQRSTSISKILVDDAYASTQDRVSFREDNGEIHRFRLYETVTMEVAAKAVTHYWETGEPDKNLSWIEQPTVPF